MAYDFTWYHFCLHRSQLRSFRRLLRLLAGTMVASQDTLDRQCVLDSESKLYHGRGDGCCLRNYFWVREFYCPKEAAGHWRFEHGPLHTNNHDFSHS